ncbi:MAG: alpha/beta hydrolase [Coxiellaceae bacterium]|nr:alpha/beta hydrolase [Coxiellaceae bacterium]
MPILKINDIDLYYEQHGKGPDLVLIGGLTSDHQVWKSTLRLLSAHFRVLIFDNRGAGQTSAPDYPYTMEMMANDTLALMNALNISKAAILGHSMGGGIAMQIALLAPLRVEKLIIACSRGKISAVSSMIFSMREKLQALGIGNDLLAEYVMPFLFSEDFLKINLNVSGFSQWTLRNPHPQSAIGFKHQLNASRSKDFTNELEKIVAPTLVIAGTEDMIATLTQTENLAKSLKNGTLATIKNCAHMPHVEYPREFSQIVLQFLTPHLSM